MKRLSRWASQVLMCSILAGCHTQPPVTRETLVGSYKYVSDDPESRPTDHNLDHLVLLADGKYDLVEGGTTRNVSEKKGVWRIEPGPGDRLTLVLDHSGYPIEATRGEIRLLVDLDVGIWWAKTN